MSRLDDHVSAVQNRLALRIFLESLAKGAVIFSSALLVGVLLSRIFMLTPPKPPIWIYAGAGLTLAGAVAYAISKRPNPQEAAVPIDEKLGLKEKISTALYVRPSDDPFAKAAVLDAEESARQIALNMGQHFPLSFPRPAYVAIVVGVLALLSLRIDPMSFFHREEKQKQQAIQDQQAANARKTVKEALAKVDAMPKVAGADDAIRLAKAELTAMLNDKAPFDPAKANRTAVKALQDINEAMKDTIKNSSKYAQAQNEMKMMRSMQKPQEGQGPVSDAHRAIADGKFSEAIDELSKAIENFDKMDKADQQKAAQQMQQLAQQLQQQANNPQQQQKMQQQLQQQAGMNQQQAQQAQQLMQQAAQGNQQAQQQLQQMAQQAMQQAGMNQQQQQQMQQMMQQMQAQMNAQQQAQNMAQAAQQMAQAMQQAAQQPRQQGAQQQQQQQQSQMNQGMGQAMNQMQQQLQQMQAAAQDAQQIAAAQAGAQQAQNAAQQAMGGGNQGGQNAQGGGMWNPNANIDGQNQSKFNGQAQFAGPNQGGQGAGDRTYKSPAPFSTKAEMDPSQDDDKGRILASFFIKDNNPNKGASTETLKEVADRALNEQTDEIDQERVSRQAQKAVKDYFSTVAKEN